MWKVNHRSRTVAAYTQKNYSFQKQISDQSTNIQLQSSNFDFYLEPQKCLYLKQTNSYTQKTIYFLTKTGKNLQI